MFKSQKKSKGSGRPAFSSARPASRPGGYPNRSAHWPAQAGTEAGPPPEPAGLQVGPRRGQAGTRRRCGRHAAVTAGTAAHGDDDGGKRGRKRRSTRTAAYPWCVRTRGESGGGEKRRRRAGDAAASAGRRATQHAQLVASRLAALNGKAEGIDAEPTAALDRPLVAGVIDNRDGDERRGSTGNEDESVRRRRWRPSFADSFDTEVKGDVANPPVGFDLDGELGIVGRVLGGGGSGGLAALGREIERGSRWGEVRVEREMSRASGEGSLDF